MRVSHTFSCAATDAGPIRPFRFLAPTVHTISRVLLVSVHVMSCRVCACRWVSLVPAFVSCAVTRTIRRLPFLSFGISYKPYLHPTKYICSRQPPYERIECAMHLCAYQWMTMLRSMVPLWLCCIFRIQPRTTQTIYWLAHSCWHSRCRCRPKWSLNVTKKGREKKLRRISNVANYLDQFSATCPSPMPLLLFLVFKSKDWRYHPICGCWGMNIR